MCIDLYIYIIPTVIYEYMSYHITILHRNNSSYWVP